MALSCTSIFVRFRTVHAAGLPPSGRCMFAAHIADIPTKNLGAFSPLTDRFAGAMMGPQTDSARDGGVTGNHAAPQKTTQSGGPCPVPGRRNADPCQGSSAQDPPTTRRRCSAGIRPGPHTEPVESTSRQRWFVLVAAVCQPHRPMHPGGEGRERRALRTAECQ